MEITVEAVAKAGDEGLEATGVEEVVIAPEGQEDALGGDDTSADFAYELEKRTTKEKPPRQSFVRKGQL